MLASVADEDRAPALLEPALGTVLGPYRLVDVLGRGSMGVVYLAEREADSERVALKVLPRELGDDDVYRRRFAREGEIARRLEHEHLVPVLATGEAEGWSYLAARYVEGASLAERLSAGALPVENVLGLAAHVASALDELHRQGLVHRDVKPANVLVDPEGKALLTDFGLAKGIADSVLTRSGRVVGTIDYLAPEIILGEPATSASDLYALGCLVFECLAGQPPFRRRTAGETCLAHVKDDPPSLSDLRADVAASLCWAAARALAKEPAERPGTARAYARLLRASAAA